MTQYHVCPQCGRRIRCTQSTEDVNTVQVFDALANNLNQSHIELSATRAYPTIKYEVYWGINAVCEPLYKTLAFWLPSTVAVIAATTHYHWPESVPLIFAVASFAGLMRAFGKVPSWHNMIESEPPTQPKPETETEDTRSFAGWETTDKTKTTLHMEWYTPPVPIKQARSFALALVNNRFEWVDERDLEVHKANISGPNYRKLRRDWIARDWASEEGKRTAIVARSMIRRIAFEEPA